MSEPGPFDDLIELIADGGVVDWAEAERRVRTPRDAELLQNLRLLARLAESHRLSAADPDSPTLPPVSAQLHDRSGQHWGRYQLLRKIGAGSYGQVYLARDDELDREVALKILHDDAGTIAEGRALARVEHTNVVPVHGVEQHDGELALCMKYIRGQTLQEVVGDGFMHPDEACVVAHALCDAVAAVHRAGVLHRDIKARNVMRERNGNYVLMDFGAGLVQTPDGSWRQAPNIGTLHYMAPELLLTNAPATKKSDIYSLGVLLYYLVTGKYPVEGEGVDDVKNAHRVGRRVRLDDRRTDLPRSYVKAVECATAVNPDERPATASELWRQLSQRDGWVPDAIRVAALAAVSVASLGVGSGLVTTWAFDRVVDRPSVFDVRGSADVIEMGFRSLIVPAFIVMLVLAVGAFLALFAKLLPWPRRLWISMWRRLLAGLKEEEYAPSIAQGSVLAGVIAVALVLWAFKDIVIAFSRTVSRHDLTLFTVFQPQAAASRVSYRICVVLLLILVLLAWRSVRHVRLSKGGSVPNWTRGAGLAFIGVLLLLSQAPYKLMNYNDAPIAIVEGLRCYVLGETATEMRAFCPAAPVPRVRTVPVTPDIERCNVEENLFLAQTTPSCPRHPEH